MTKNTIIHGDSLTELKKMADCSIDAVITDPPYGIDFQSAWRTDSTKRHKKIANDKQPFIWWLYDAYRVTKEGGALLCFCRWDVADDFKRAIEWSGYEIKSQVIWDREHHGMGDLKGAFAPQHDIIWFATKGKFIFPNKRPKSVVSSKRLGGDKLTHPNEKPVDLMEQLIEAVTQKDDVVLDPFAGSGSTIVAANNLDRDGVGIELDGDYVTLARSRLL